jgi:HAD superfamily hydrolase (TIGR01509 family)
MQVDLVIFDLDGVLVESEVILARTLSARLADIGIAITAEEIVRRFHYRPFPAIVETLAEEQGVSAPSAFIDALPAIYAEAIDHRLTAVAGAEEMLAALTLPKCVASGSRPDNLRRKLEIVGFLGHFGPHLYSAFEVARPKPAPDIFLHAAQRLATPPEHCLVVEDAVPGIAAARAAGMHALGFCGAGHCHDAWEETLRTAGADGILHDLTGLPAYIERLKGD